MPYTNDPENSVTDRLRLRTGDIDPYEEGLTDEVYLYLYDKHDQNENKAALEALQMLVFKYANYVTERSGEYYIEAEERYDNYKQLLDDALKDPSYGFMKTGTAFAGGIDCEDRRGANRSCNPFVLGDDKARFTSGGCHQPHSWIRGCGK